MILKIGDLEYRLTWRDGAFVGGALVACLGVGAAFGWGAVAAFGGCAMMFGSRADLRPPVENTQNGAG